MSPPADNSEAELEAVATAMADVDIQAASTDGGDPVDETNSAAEPKQEGLASLLRSPFEDAIGAVALQRLGQSA